MHCAIAHNDIQINGPAKLCLSAIERHIIKPRLVNVTILRFVNGNETGVIIEVLCNEMFLFVHRSWTDSEWQSTSRT